ncbi:uncharacterized protein C1orf87 [Anguilla anguilla]|uniref:uncharacterized protein C1orf87 n=1 Tax=Anguilla anguilla TaxID=7936 RepID=UPI0015AF1384|nr:uncharacterized protein C1orf87 [Anguilla anguilla]
MTRLKLSCAHHSNKGVHFVRWIHCAYKSFGYSECRRVMASGNTAGADTAPQLVVKLIGSKLIRYYTEEPEKEKEVNSDASGESTNLPQNIESRAAKSPPDEEGVATQTRHTSGGGQWSPWPVLPQVPGRHCVTAPPGCRSLACTNPKKTPTLRSAPHVALRLNSSKLGVRSASMEKEETKGTEHHKEEKDVDLLFTAVSEELKDWRKEALRNIEMELQELDPSHCGTVDHFDLTQVLFRNEVPLKLPTLQLLLHTFSSSACPEEIHYKDLLSLVTDAVLEEEQQEKTEPDVGNALQRSASVSDPTHSEPPPGLGLPRETEIWLQRFQKMEEAMWMCDTQNSGFIDKDKARRLIQNYNLIFDLNLSPVKIDEAIRGSQSESRVHLDSLLQILKEL